jgi:hypothetical protein
LIEAAAVFGMILAYIWWWRPVYPLSWIVVLGLVIASHVYRRETPAWLGFRLTNLKTALVACGRAVFVAALALLTVGALCNTIRQVNPASALLSLGLYCFWGLFQQYLLNGYFLNRFTKTAPAASPLIAALSFSAIHAPNWFLMIVTLFGGFVSAKVYLRFRNLYVLGLGHGIIGFLLYLCVPDTISHHLYVGPRYFR